MRRAAGGERTKDDVEAVKAVEGVSFDVARSALAGVNVLPYPAEHFCLVTGRIDGVHPTLPVLRDPDGLIDQKVDIGGLAMGGSELEAKPWNIDTIPAGFLFQLLPEDWDPLRPLMTSALHRTPCLEGAPIKLLPKGPESFMPDGQLILAAAPGVADRLHCSASGRSPRGSCGAPATRIGCRSAVVRVGRQSTRCHHPRPASLEQPVGE